MASGRSLLARSGLSFRRAPATGLYSVLLLYWYTSTDTDAPLACTGNSPIIIAVECTAGIVEGGRTGLTAVPSAKVLAVRVQKYKY